jgi:hypothetical protein
VPSPTLTVRADASHGGEAHRLLADEGRSQMTALRFPSRTEDLWSPTPLLLTFADRLAIPPRSDREQPL